MQDYPKYAVWPDGYYVGVNNGGTVIALERADMPIQSLDNILCGS
jgi:hypothetical protein